MAENFNANQLTKHCVLYTMEHFVEVSRKEEKALKGSVTKAVIVRVKVVALCWFPAMWLKLFETCLKLGTPKWALVLHLRDQDDGTRRGSS